MRKDKVVQVTSSVGDPRIGYGKVVIKEFLADDKLKYASKSVILFWLAAAFCAMIPTLQYILVPLFIFLGIISFSKSIKIEGQIIKGHVDCPNCKNYVTVQKGFLKWPIKEICKKCKRKVTISCQT